MGSGLSQRESSGLPDALAASETGWTGGHSPWLIAFVVTLATFMELLDTSIANVSLPQIAGNLGVSRNEGTWVLTSYLVANAVIIPCSGWLSERFGRKRMYLACVVVFTLASLACGLAPSIDVLVVCRVVQGLGGGGLVPIEQAILIDTFPPARRGAAMAVYGMTTVLAPALGPTIGGLVTDHLSWRWIFFINIPVGVLSVVLARRFLTDPPHLRRTSNGSQVDWAGLVLVALGLGCLEVVLERGEEAGWFDATYIRVFTVAALAALFLMVRRELAHQSPILDLQLLRYRNFAVANALMFLLSFTAFAVTVMLPQYLWALMGYTASDAGLVLSPGGLLIFCLLPVTGRLVSRADPRVLLTIGFVMVGGSLFYTARTINPAMSFEVAVRLRMLQCAGFAFLFVPIQVVAYSAVPLGKNTRAASVLNLSRNMGASVGIACLVTLLFRDRQLHQVSLVANATAFDPEFRRFIAGVAPAFQAVGSTSVDAWRRALAAGYARILEEGMHLAYVNAAFAFVLAAAAAVGITWFARWPVSRPQPDAP